MQKTAGDNILFRPLRSGHQLLWLTVQHVNVALPCAHAHHYFHFNFEGILFFSIYFISTLKAEYMSLTVFIIQVESCTGIFSNVGKHYAFKDLDGFGIKPIILYFQGS